MSKRIDLAGLSFGFLTVSRYNGNRKWYCLCVCGSCVSVKSFDLRAGRTKSCGCKKAEIVATKKTTHGCTGTQAYKAWLNMKRRCYDVNNNRYKNYGGRGISVSPRWITNFESFIAYIGEHPGKGYSIDRINVDGNYEPGNVRWATTKEQGNNTTTTIYFDYLGCKKSLVALSNLSGLSPSTIKARIIVYGWSVDKAVTAPLLKRKLNDDQIRYILNSHLSQSSIAKELGVSKSLIRKIRSYEEGYAEFE